MMGGIVPAKRFFYKYFFIFFNMLSDAENVDCSPPRAILAVGGGFDYIAIPPSTQSTCPVIYPASSPAKKAAALATS